MGDRRGRGSRAHPRRLLTLVSAMLRENRPGSRSLSVEARAWTARALGNLSEGSVKVASVGDTGSVKSLGRGHRFAPEIISHAVWLCHRFTLSCRDVEYLLAWRDVTVSYEATRLWCRKFGFTFARNLRRRHGRLGDAWHVDKVFVTIRGQVLGGRTAVQKLEQEVDLLGDRRGASADRRGRISSWRDCRRSGSPPCQRSQLRGLTRSKGHGSGSSVFDWGRIVGHRGNGSRRTPRRRERVLGCMG